MSLSFADLENLWVANGGSPVWAPTMAAVAMLESGGNPSATNPSGATGLWQIEWPLHSGIVPGATSQAALEDPNVNAQAAVNLLGPGAGISNWGAGTGDAVGTYVQQNGAQPLTIQQLQAAGFGQYTGAGSTNLPAQGSAPTSSGGGATAGGGQGGAPYTPSSIPGIPSTPPNFPDFTANPYNEISRVLAWTSEFAGWAFFIVIVFILGVALFILGTVVLVAILAGPAVGPIAAAVGSKSPVGRAASIATSAVSTSRANADTRQLEAQRAGTSEPRSTRQGNREAEEALNSSGVSRPAGADRRTRREMLVIEDRTHRGRRVAASSSGPAF